MEQPFLCDLDASDFEALRQVALGSARLLWVCPDDDPHMAVAIGWLRVLQSENAKRQYQYLNLEEAADRSSLDLALAIAKVVMAQTDEREFVERDGSYKIPRWSYDLEMTRTVTDSTLSQEVDSVRLGNVASTSSLRMVHGGDPKHAHFVPDHPRLPHLAAEKVEVELKFINVTHYDLVDPGTRTLREGFCPAPRAFPQLRRSSATFCLAPWTAGRLRPIFSSRPPRLATRPCPPSHPKPVCLRSLAGLSAPGHLMALDLLRQLRRPPF